MNGFEKDVYLITQMAGTYEDYPDQTVENRLNSENVPKVYKVTSE